MSKNIKLSLAFFLFIIAALYSATCWYFSGLIVTPNRKTKAINEINATEASLTEKSGTTDIQALTLTSADGEQIPLWYYSVDKDAMQDSATETSRCAIVFLHGWGETRLQGRHYFNVFDTLKCDYIIYDHRAHGNHMATFGTGGVKESEDLLTVVTWLQQKKHFDAEQIGFYGLSWGASTALLAGANIPKYGFIVADSPFESWQAAIFERGIRTYGRWVTSIRPGVNLAIKLRTGHWLSDADMLKGAAKIQTPTLLIHSQTDSATNSNQSVNIAKNLSQQRSKFIHTDWGAGHIGDYDKRPAQYRAEILQFIAQHSPQFGRK